MDAVLGNVRNSFEVSMKKMWTGTIKKGNTVSLDKNKSNSKLFGAALCDICDRESVTVPYIVKDICTYIEKNFIDCEGIFRLSSAASSTSKLRDAFDLLPPSPDRGSVCSNTGVDGHTAANVLKQFLRQLPQPLIFDDVLAISRQAKCVSDESFAASIRSAMETWPAAHRCTLQYLLSFLQLVMRNVENRMTVTGVAVVFGPNVFKIAGGAVEGLEILGLANQTFERMLLTADVICSNSLDDQGYLNMTSPTSVPAKPTRPAPHIPKPVRPLPAPPVPIHASDDLIIRSVTSPPSPPVRSKSLERHLASGDFYRSEGEETNSSYHSSEDEVLKSRPADPLPNNPIVDETIKDVIRKRLFTAESLDNSASFDGELLQQSNDDVTVTSLLPSLTAGRASGPRNRRRPTRRSRSFNDSQDDAEAPLAVHGEVHLKDRVEFASEDYATVTAEDQLECDDENLANSIPENHVDVVFENPAKTAPVPLPRKSILSNPSPNLAHPKPIVAEEEDTAMVIEEDNSTPPVAMETTIAAASVVYSPTSEDKLSENVLENNENEDDDLKRSVVTMEDKTSASDANEVVPPLDLSEFTQIDEVLHPKPLPRKEKTTPTKARKRRRKAHQSSPSATKYSPKPSMESMSELADDDAEPTKEVSSGDRSQNDGSSKWRDAWSTDEESVPMLKAMENVIKRSPPVLRDDDVHEAPTSPDTHLPRHHHRHHHHHEGHLSRPKTRSNSIKEANLEALHLSLQDITRALNVSRKDNNRPEELTLMTRDQIRMEKVAMQRELLKHETRHGRPSSKQEKEVMRNIYERYRMVKRLLADVLSPPFNSPTSHRRFDVIEKDCDVDALQQTDEFAVTQILTLAPPDGKKNLNQKSLDGELNDHVSADVDISELRKQEKEAKGRRKRVRRKLRDFEREIEQQHGRTVNQADRVVMATEYAEYRDLKAKIRLLDALIEKHNSKQKTE